MANVRYPTEVPTDMTIPILSSLSECWNESNPSKFNKKGIANQLIVCKIPPPPVSTIGFLKINQKQGYPSLHIFWKDKGSVSAQSNKLRYIGNSITYWLSYWIGSAQSRYDDSMGIESWDEMHYHYALRWRDFGLYIIDAHLFILVSEVCPLDG